jgi:hypothetical protein
MAESEIKVLVEQVRSFAVRQEIPIRPLTLLVGENSSGKTTFLAVASVVFDSDRFPGRPGFNEPPFNLGTFETIATYKGGKYGRDESFSMGYSVGEVGKASNRSVEATYARASGKLVLRRFTGKSNLGSFEINNGEILSGSIAISTPGQAPVRHEFRWEESTRISDQLSLSGGIFSIAIMSLSKQRAARFDQHEVDRLFRLFRSMESPFRSIYSFAPIRTRPKRTYDELTNEYSPEGDHTPKLLAHVLAEETRDGVSGRVREALTKFGKESGLFKDVEVKRLGKGADDPFQVQVALGGPRVNLMDVGYGVSQALPVIVQSVIRREKGLLLIQQPEVHLHPRAQAALGTFFAELVAAGRDTLLIETHSDYLVDRVRQAVAKGTISPEQVMILFFDHPKVETTVYPITLDRLGNVEGAPPQYREFFLQETENLFTRGEA